MGNNYVTLSDTAIVADALDHEWYIERLADGTYWLKPPKEFICVLHHFAAIYEKIPYKNLVLMVPDYVRVDDIRRNTRHIE